MKYLITTIAVLGIAGLVVYEMTRPNFTQQVIYAPDLTESYLPLLSEKEIKAVSVITDSANAGETFRIVPITELTLNPVSESNIAPVGNRWLSNDRTRTQDIDRYWADIRNQLSDLKQKQYDRPGSVIIPVLVQELNRLRELEADRKILITTTDGMEQSAFMDFYKKEPLHSDQVVKAIDKAYPLEGLSGITIVFVYRPKDKKDDMRFAQVSALYKQWLSEKGARVIITSSLTKNTLSE